MSLCFRFVMFYFFPGFVIQGLAMEVGINYGQIANNLPSPSRVAVLLQSLNVQKIKLYDADPNVLQAFANSNVEFIIGLGSVELSAMANLNKAESWIQQNVQPYLPQTKITCITVGNEVLSNNDTSSWPYLLPAMQSVYTALKNLGLQQQVTVTTAHSLSILQSSFPPSSGSFKPDLIVFLKPIIDFLAQINSPFLINAYPYFAYKADPQQISLDYVLFRPNPGMSDPKTSLHYDNMLYAQIDAVYSAIRTLGHSDIPVRISETGWPSKGDEDEVGATVENAAEYNGNLLRKLTEKQFTPANPSVPLDIYVFALFNEDLKPGPASERNYGLFYPDETPVYNLKFQSYLPEMDVAFADKIDVWWMNFFTLLLAFFICDRR